MNEYRDCNRLKEGKCIALTEKLCKTREYCPFYKPRVNSGFAANLRYWREKRGISQRALAERCGISGASLCCYETGQREPQVTTAKKIADELGVLLDTLCV